MKILGIEGSPRKQGNTEKLVRAILDGAGEQGHETELCKLAEMKISPCLGCIGCRETGECVIKDDMSRVYDKMQAAQAIVIGSPVYMWQVSAQTKIFMDRLVPFIKPDFSSRLSSEKRLLLAFTQGNPDSQAFKPYFDYMEKLLSFLHFQVRGTLVASGTRERDDILRQNDVLERARAMGKSLAS